ncbi:MAG TPA: chemotaxis response regulator protein-glutamate methylesterase [Terracidiphilus sp.]|nr:chemotaxis response regulator protein-glutamate methylesterase [Terracidiphilus sp.]
MISQGRTIRVLIVDDSAMMRSALRSVVSGDPRLEVAGTAVDGATALQSIAVLEPDVVLLDVEMPVMDGLTTLKRLRAQNSRLPVIMVSSVTQRGARVTIEALASGASDYVAKPAAQSDREAAVRALAEELRPKIHALAQKARAAECTQHGPRALLQAWSPAAHAPAVVAIGVSTGGPAALEEMLPRLPGSFPLPVLVVQHMPEMFTSLLAERLDKACALRVVEAADGDTVMPGRIVIARGGHHLEIAQSGDGGKAPILRLTAGPEENHCRPSVDVLFRSLAQVYGGCVMAAILTGMGSDGLAGCRVLRRLGATIVVQDEASSTVWGMPGAVAAAGLAHHVLPLAQIPWEMQRMAGGVRHPCDKLCEAAI